jgi:hypothetical protein
VNPYGTNNQVVKAKIRNYQDGTKYRLLCQVSSDGTDYYFAEWHYVDSMTMEFSIGSSNAGVLETLTDSPIPEGTEVQFYVTEKHHYCMSDTSSRITICMPEKDNPYVGLAAGSSVGATFDDFVFESHFADNSDCPICDCMCDGWCVPDALVATFQDLNECPDLDGFTIDLDNSSPTKFGTGWQQAAAVACPSAIFEDIEIQLQCDAGGFAGNYELTFLQGGVSVLSYYADPDASTCYPLSLRFGPFSYGSVSGCFDTTCCGGNPCGTGPGDESLFYVWITKRLTDYDY